MIIITVANQKGGVGKTTTTVNIAASLALSGKRVLIVDAEPQAQAMQCFGVRPGKVPVRDSVGMLVQREAQGDHIDPDGFMGALRDRTEVLHQYFDPEGLGTIHILCAEHDSVEKLNGLLNNIGVAAMPALRTMLKRVDHLFDFALVDTPPNLGSVATLGHVTGDLLLSPALPEPMCIQGTLSMRAAGKAVSAMTKKKYNPLFVGTVMTRYLPPSKLNPEKRGATSGAIKTINTLIRGGALPFTNVIMQSDPVKDQMAAGVPAVLSHNSYGPGKQYTAIVDEMIERMTTPQEKWRVLPLIDVSMANGEVE